jgi:fructose-1,6-bisphosphatase/inositol monophosphatase family enzyme
MIRPPQDIIKFALSMLVPASCEALRNFYESYKAGDNLAVLQKSDDTPASAADRETESVMRKLIAQHYPEHGIIGEEMGAENLSADWVWILDPLDGTREFLDKQEGGFGNLTALCFKGQPVLGIIAEPIKGTILSGCLADALLNDYEQLSDEFLLDTISIACTNAAMFKNDLIRARFADMQSRSKACYSRLNCNGFSNVAQGKIDLAIESDLALHDIAALIPVLSSHGKTVIDFEGRNYAQNYFFDLDSSRKFDIIAARDSRLANDALAYLKG